MRDRNLRPAARDAKVTTADSTLGLSAPSIKETTMKYSSSMPIASDINTMTTEATRLEATASNTKETTGESNSVSTAPDTKVTTGKSDSK